MQQAAASSAQAALQAAGGTSPAAVALPPGADASAAVFDPASTPHQAQQQPQQQQQAAGVQGSVPVTVAGADAAMQAQLQRLRAEVERARAQLAAAQADNERLMELSNEVRAQRDRCAHTNGRVAPTRMMCPAGILQPQYPLCDNVYARRKAHARA